MSANHKCHCTDPECPVHMGESKCSVTGPTTVLYRVDMSDETGTPMCEACASDAFDSGLFSVDFPEDQDDWDAQAEQDAQDYADSQENAYPRCVW